MNLRNFQSVKDRREALEKQSGVTFPNIGSFTLDESVAATRNCENMIGAAQIPLGIAGPLKLTTYNPEPTTKQYYLPLATTEGALIASVNRGCKAIEMSGGAMMFTERIGATRGPVFQTRSLAKSHELKEWLLGHVPEIAAVAEATASHLRLLSQEIRIAGRQVFVRYAFDTQDAMGMNMVTIATQAIGKYVEERTGETLLSVSGNFCVDKKPAWQNVILGRGFRAWSEVVLPTTVITEILKTSSQALFDVWRTKCLVGAAITGSMGVNGHAANTIAALFLATGQDLSHIVEGSTTLTTMDVTENGLAVNVTIPSLMVGTVGGGTSLATQQEALSLLGVAGGNTGKHAEELAGIVAGAVLAGEVSELAALSSNTLTHAHERLGRGIKS